MSKQKLYTGKPCNLGRFGDVKEGDILTLTDSEAAMVERDRDKRFKDIKPGAKVQPVSHLKEIKPGMSSEEVDIVNAWNREETARVQSLAKANDTYEVRLNELREMKDSQIRDIADGLGLSYKAQTPRSTLIGDILAKEGLATRDQNEDGADAGESPAPAPEGAEGTGEGGKE